MTTIALIAKEPLPGKVKTRLHPAVTLEQAAELAAASIRDTLTVMADLPATRRILLFDGTVLPDGIEGFDVIPQVAGTLDQRLAALFDHATEPIVLIGMDTPQLTVDHLLPAFDQWPDSIDAWFGPATDGGFWALGMREPRGNLIRGVPMSRNDTGFLQLRRLSQAFMRVGMLSPLCDVDTIDDAYEAAALAPHSHFAAALSRFVTNEVAA